MASPNIGDRVKWIHNEPGSDPMQLHGEVTGMKAVYTIRWDDGTTDTEIDPDDIELEDA